MRRGIWSSRWLVLLLLVGCREGLDRSSNTSTLYLTTSRLRGFDPVKVNDLPSGFAIGRVYEGLLQHSYLERPYKLEPLLCESMPEVSSNGLVYTFRLRKGIYFQDDPCFPNGKGRELVADDFVYSFKRLADRKTTSVGWWIFNGQIKGLDAFREASGGSAPTKYEEEVSGLRALDRYTLQIEVNKPAAQLLWVLAMHHCVAVPREAVDYYRDRFSVHPVGTGPYILKSWKRNYRLEYVRNPKWRETGRADAYPSIGETADGNNGLLADAGKALPLLERIVTFTVPDPATQWLMFLRGQLDRSEISRDNWNVVLDENRQLFPELLDQGIQLAVGPGMTIGYIGFNMDDPVVGKNLKLRQAMSLAFNGDDWIKLNNYRIARANGPIPMEMPGRIDGPNLFPFDLSRARKLMAEAGYPEGKDPTTDRRLELVLEIGRADDLESRQSAELFADFMGKIGIVVRPSYNNWPTFLDKLDRRQVQLYSLAWIADYPDADNFLQLFHSGNASPGPNHSNYVNPEYDRIYDEAHALPDSPERTALFARLQEIVRKDCPWIFASDPLTFVLQQPRVKNYKYHPFAVGLEKYLRLEGEGP